MKIVISLALAFAMLLAGCAQFSFDARERNLSEREHRYNAALRTLADGSTRADLERLFPCARPQSFSPGIFSVAGVFIFPPEEHPVDGDFVVSVSYIYSHITFRQRPHSRRGGQATRRQQIEAQANAIDALLFGGGPVLHPSASDLIQNLPLRVERRHQQPNHALQPTAGASGSHSKFQPLLRPSGG